MGAAVNLDRVAKMADLIASALIANEYDSDSIDNHAMEAIVRDSRQLAESYVEAAEEIEATEP